MVYAATITLPAGGSQADPVTHLLSIAPGLIWLFECDFPPGCCGLAHVQVFDGSYQVFPATPNESFHGDAAPVHLDDLYMKSSPPNELVIKGWNEDEEWDHTLQIRVGVAMTRAEMSRYMPALAWENFEKLLAEMVAAQEVARQAQLEAALKAITPP
jgi:hypothetical protein